MATTKVGIGMLGYAFMGKAHSNAFRKLSYIFHPPPGMPVLVGVCGRTADKAEQAKEKFGYKYSTTDWRDLIKDSKIILLDGIDYESIFERSIKK